MTAPEDTIIEAALTHPAQHHLRVPVQLSSALEGAQQATDDNTATPTCVTLLLHHGGKRRKDRAADHNLLGRSCVGPGPAQELCQLQHGNTWAAALICGSPWVH